MHDTIPRKIKTGGDPRTLPDYATLRDELSKLTHPARPDVNWQYVEKLCLSLFEQNGVELQTAAWYTLARTQLVGLFGLNEGLAILEALISHQWGALWPQPVHARMEILSSLSLRLQQRMRALSLSYSDLSHLYRAEQLLGNIGVVLQRLELKHLSQLETLRTLMHNNAARLENIDDASNAGASISSAIVINGTTASTSPLAGHSPEENRASESTVKWVYVVQSKPPENEDMQAEKFAKVEKWKSFVVGMCTMLVISIAVVWTWQHLRRPDPLQAQLTATLDPLPAILTPAQLDVLHQQSPISKSVIARTQQQLIRLEKLPPDWNISYSRQLAEQVQSLWPELAEPLMQQWQQQLDAAALPTEHQNGWYEGMMTLQKLSERLNGLDEKKGKYMTVSELKSVVFSAMQSFNRSIPAEEQLRALSQTPAGQAFPSAAKTQTEMHLKQLIARYVLVTQGNTQNSQMQHKLLDE